MLAIVSNIVLAPKQNCIPADLWKRRLHGDSAEHSGTGTSTLAGSSSSALSRRPAKHAQHSTDPGMFVSAASLKADSAFGQQRHESTRPSQRRATQPGPGQHRASWAADGVEEQVEGSEVIDLIGSPGRMSKACFPAQNICCLCTVGKRRLLTAEIPMFISANERCRISKVSVLFLVSQQVVTGSRHKRRHNPGSVLSMYNPPFCHALACLC